MGYKLGKSYHSVYALQYHLVQCVKYRRKVFTNDKIMGFLKQKIYGIFPETKKKLWKGMFWSRSYFLARTGQVTLDVLKKYVESLGEK